MIDVLSLFLIGHFILGSTPIKKNNQNLGIHMSIDIPDDNIMLKHQTGILPFLRVLYFFNNFFLNIFLAHKYIYIIYSMFKNCKKLNFVHFMQHLHYFLTGV